MLQVFYLRGAGKVGVAGRRRATTRIGVAVQEGNGACSGCGGYVGSDGKGIAGLGHKDQSGGPSTQQFVHNAVGIQELPALAKRKLVVPQQSEPVTYIEVRVRVLVGERDELYILRGALLAIAQWV